MSPKHPLTVILESRSSSSSPVRVVRVCATMCYIVLLCGTMCYYVLLYATMCYYVLICATMSTGEQTRSELFLDVGGGPQPDPGLGASVGVSQLERVLGDPAELQLARLPCWVVTLNLVCLFHPC